MTKLINRPRTSVLHRIYSRAFMNEYDKSWVFKSRPEIKMKLRNYSYCLTIWVRWPCKEKETMGFGILNTTWEGSYTFVLILRISWGFRVKIHILSIYSDLKRFNRVNIQIWSDSEYILWSGKVLSKSIYSDLERFWVWVYIPIWKGSE